MNFDNTYVLDKIIESLVLAVVAQLLIGFKEYTHFLVLAAATFITLVLLDVLLGKVNYAIPSSVINVKLPGLPGVTTPLTGSEGVSEQEGAMGDASRNPGFPQKGGAMTLPNAAALRPTPIPDASHMGGPCQSCTPIQQVRFCGQPRKGRIPSFYDIKKKTDIIEPMDDPVAKLYYSQNRLPETINMEGLYKRQFGLDDKPCAPSPKCQTATKVDPCLKLPALGVEGALFETAKQAGQSGAGTWQTGGSDEGAVDRQSFEARYRQEGDEGLCDCKPTCRPPCASARGQSWRVNALKSAGKSPEATPAWLFGTFHHHLDGNGKVNFRAAPYCADSPYIECQPQTEPVLGDHLEPKCAVGNPSCLPCDLSEVPLDFAHPLRDTVIKRDFYRECRKQETRDASQKPVKCRTKSVVQPHYVKSYPKYVMTRKNLAIKNPIPPA